MKSNSKEKFPLGLDFFSLFIHELKSPLMSLQFQLENLSSEINHTSKNSQKIMQRMNQDIHRLFQFIEDGLNMKETEGSFPLHRKECLWSDVLEKNQENLKVWLDSKKLKIKNLKNSSVKIHIDPRWMDVVITNLLLNAIQHAPEKSFIWLKTDMTDDQNLLFSVRDEGPGINQDLQDKLFHRFQSGRKTSNSYLKGTGLGLYITKAIVEGHGGQIYVEPHKLGCEFFVILPRAFLVDSQKAS